MAMSFQITIYLKNLHVSKKLIKVTKPRRHAIESCQINNDPAFAVGTEMWHAMVKLLFDHSVAWCFSDLSRLVLEFAALAA
jgi:hypothetical protein